MKWKDRRRSTNVEDRRGQRVTGGVRGAGLGGVLFAVFARGSLKTKSILIGAAIAAMFVFGISPQTLLSLVGAAAAASRP